jgi:hypothetical protein
MRVSKTDKTGNTDNTAKWILNVEQVLSRDTLFQTSPEEGYPFQTFPGIDMFIRARVLYKHIYPG